MSDPRVEASYAYCSQVARTEARNFYYSFTVLSPEKKAAMCAVYAFMRHSDDVSDEDAPDGGRGARMTAWRAALDRALRGDYGDDQILPAFHDTVRRYGIPEHLFHDLIDGVEMDLTRDRYETFEDLKRYCYLVAGVVGLVCLYVWGFDGGETAYPPAEACGLAFQLTNILRDVKEDAERGRIYLPMEDLRRFGCTEEEVLQSIFTERFRELMRFEAARARECYERALPLLEMIHPEGRPTFVIMFRIYRGLLDRIEERGYDVFSMRARLSTPRKIGIVARAWLGSHLPGGERLLRV